jgi:hypothetical protein
MTGKVAIVVGGAHGGAAVDPERLNRREGL